MSSRRRRERHLTPLIPPELCEEEGHVCRVETDAQGRKSYILLSETVLEMEGQPRPSPQHRVHYKNGDKLDNRRENLEWRLPPVGPAPLDNTSSDQSLRVGSQCG